MVTFRQSREIIDNKLSIVSPVKPETLIQNLELTPAEDKVIHILNLLLSRKSERFDQTSPLYYLGNHQPGRFILNNEVVETARLLIKPHEFYSTYYGRKDYNSGHSKFLLNIVMELSKKQFLVTFNFSSTQGITKFRTHLPLFQMELFNPGLTPEESCAIDHSDTLLEGRKCCFLFKFSPIFTLNIRERYVEFPEDIHLRIAHSKAVGSRKRIPQCINLMRDLLFREKQQKRFEISRDESTLIEVLRLLKDSSSGRKARVQERLQKCFEVFQELGLIQLLVKEIGSKGQIKYRILINQDFQ